MGIFNFIPEKRKKVFFSLHSFIIYSLPHLFFHDILSFLFAFLSLSLTFLLLSHLLIYFLSPIFSFHFFLFLSCGDLTVKKSVNIHFFPHFFPSLPTSSNTLLTSPHSFFFLFRIFCRKLTVNKINKSMARKALYDNIYADIGDAATEESAEVLRKEVCIHSLNFYLFEFMNF